MNKKLLIVFRLIFSVALLIIFAGLLTTTLVQSADPNSITATGTLVVRKIVVNDNGGSLTASNFSFKIGEGTATPFDETGDSDGNPLTGENSIEIEEGSYSITEVPVTGYDTTDDGNCANIIIIATQTSICTFTNNDQQGTLNVKKLVINDNGGTLTASNFSFQVDGGAVTPFDEAGDSDGNPLTGQNTFTLDAGTYSVTEPPKAGYSTTDNGNCASVLVTNGGTATCQFTNNDQQGTLNVKKLVINDNGGTLTASNFSFQVDGGAVTPFDEAGDSDGNPLTGQNTFTLDAGTYSVTEPPKAGYSTIDNGNCASVIVTNGGTATCQFTNNDQQGTLNVKKLVINDNGGTLPASNFSFQVDGGAVTPFDEAGDSDGNPLTGQNTFTLDAGTYSVTEPPKAGYSTTDNGNCASVIVTNGGTATCQFTNDDDPPSLTLVKIVNNDNSGIALATDWTLTATGPTPISGSGGAVSGPTFVAGIYTLSESVGPLGYSASAWICVGGLQVLNQITLGLGESATCTITNDDDTPSLTLVKNLVKDNGGTASATDWTLTATGPTTISGAGGAVSGPTFVAGTYTLSESVGPLGYTASAWSCLGGSQVGNQITLGLGESATCTITNDDVPPSLTLVKNLIKDNGGTASATDWTLTATGPTTISGAGGVISGPTFDAGTYTLSESVGPLGYTASAWSCVGGTQDGNQVTVGPGESVTCTITNDDDTPSLTLAKNLIKDNGGTASATDWTLTATGPTTISGAGGAVSDATFDAGTYTLSESVGPVGYSASAWSCIGGTQLGAQITLGLGESATCTITNNDVGFNITPISLSLLTSESGLKATFDVVLDTMPTVDVTLALSSPPPTEGTIDKTSLTFTVAKWNEPQTVTITGVDDDFADGDQVYEIVTGTVTTADPDYDSLNPGTIIPDVQVTNSDNDTPGYTIAPNTDLWTSEGGAAETIQILLKSRPTGPVKLEIVSSDTDEGTVSLSSITINPDPWPPAAPKQFTVTGVDDCKTGGDNFKVTITGTSSDPNYDGRKEVLNLTNYDAPTIAWVQPVGNGKFYDSDGSSPINLKVISLCPEPIQKVRFYRWSTAIGDNVTIGEDLAPPYDEILFADELEPGVNQIRAFAFSPANPVSTFSEHELIFITLGDLIYLPLVYK